jgi:hypothetical protein
VGVRGRMQRLGQAAVRGHYCVNEHAHFIIILFYHYYFVFFFGGDFLQVFWLNLHPLVELIDYVSK